MEGYLLSLDEGECARLLASQRVGRIAFVGADGLSVHPVSYVWQAGRIFLRTGPGSTLAQLPDGMPVAFQVDEVDEPTSTGWSVLARGSLVARLPDTSAPMAQPWVPGDRSHSLAIEVSRLTGRAVSAPA